MHENFQTNQAKISLTSVFFQMVYETYTYFKKQVPMILQNSNCFNCILAQRAVKKHLQRVQQLQQQRRLVEGKQTVIESFLFYSLKFQFLSFTKFDNNCSQIETRLNSTYLHLKLWKANSQAGKGGWCACHSKPKPYRSDCETLQLPVRHVEECNGQFQCYCQCQKERTSWSCKCVSTETSWAQGDATNPDKSNQSIHNA